MRSIATITDAPDPEEAVLTTLENVKEELHIAESVTTYDDILTRKIREATSDIEAHLGRVLSRATLSERFWGDPGCSEYLILARAPVASITSVTVDDVALTASDYRLDPDTGQLYRLDSSGFPSFWSWCKDVVVVFVGGYLISDDPEEATLPPVLEAACIELVSSFWQSRGRDPLVKAENIPGLGSFEYWVGAVGEAGNLPPSVDAKIAPFRRVLV